MTENENRGSGREKVNKRGKLIERIDIRTKQED